MFNEISSRIISIVITLCFFVIGTFLWQRLHINYLNTQSFLNSLEDVSVKNELVLSDLKKISDKKSKGLDSYTFTVNNIES